MQEKSKDNQTEDIKEKITVSELGDTFGLTNWEALEAMELLEGNLSFEDSLKGKTSKEIIEFRFNQPDYSQLAEYVTGLRPENEEILDKLSYDQEKVRVKYGLPSIDWVCENPTEYERFLKDIAKKKKVHIRNKLDCDKLFSEDNDIGAVYLYERRAIGVDIDEKNEKTYLASLFTLEHEIIHSLQDIKFSRLPIEVVEYEAYVAALDLEYLEEEPEEIGWNFFGGNYVGGSVKRFYERGNEERNKNGEDIIEPEWKDPEFFLKNVDQIDEKEIEKYKRKVREWLLSL